MCSIQIVSTPHHYLKAVSMGATSGSQECKPTKHRGGSEEPLIAWIQLTGQPPGHVLSMTSPNRHPRVKVRVLVTQPCPALCNPMDCSPPGSSVYGILQARILEWIAIPFSRGFSQPRDQTQVSCIASEFFSIRATRNGISALIKEILTELANPSTM